MSRRFEMGLKKKILIISTRMTKRCHIEPTKKLLWFSSSCLRPCKSCGSNGLWRGINAGRRVTLPPTIKEGPGGGINVAIVSQYPRCSAMGTFVRVPSLLYSTLSVWLSVIMVLSPMRDWQYGHLGSPLIIFLFIHLHIHELQNTWPQKLTRGLRAVPMQIIHM